jgi:hypothetical protein
MDSIVALGAVRADLYRGDIILGQPFHDLGGHVLGR